MFSAPEQRRDWAQRGLLGAVPTQRNTVHFQGYPGLLWCNFPGETHSIENWDLVPTALPQHHVGMGMRSLLKSSCRGKASLKPNSVICNHLSKPLGFFFFVGFSCAQPPVSMWQPAVLAMLCPGPGPASFSFLLHICPLGVRADTSCESTAAS